MMRHKDLSVSQMSTPATQALPRTANKLSRLPHIIKHVCRICPYREELNSPTDKH